MNVIMYPHGGSGNRGCEAIVRSTCKVLGENNYTLFSTQLDQDRAVGLDRICQVKPQVQPISRFSMSYAKAWIQTHLLHNTDAFDQVAYGQIFDCADQNTLALSIGGDNYCYGEAKHIYFMNKYIRKAGAKTVLWGCSVDEKDISPEMRKDLQGYDLIYARESLTYDALIKINPNTKLYPDPAFQLDKVELTLPDGFEEGNTVGINVSPLIMDCENQDGITYKNYQILIRHILDYTDMKIALIAHVIWPDNDDRKPLHRLYEEFKDTGRIVEIFEGNCEGLKGYISRCRFMVCARTHASIAAYSTCVPTLVVGYSVKARGIAKDIFGTHENYVLPVQSLQQEGDLINAFQWLMEQEQDVRSHLEKFMPKYKERVWQAKADVERLM